MGGQCLRGPIVYRAAVIANNKAEFYTGIAGNSFKGRWDGHKCTIKYSKLRDKTTLSQHIWNLKDSETNYTLEWKIIENAPILNHKTGKCKLCDIERYLIMFKPEDGTINKTGQNSI